MELWVLRTKNFDSYKIADLIPLKDKPQMRFFHKTKNVDSLSFKYDRANELEKGLICIELIEPQIKNEEVIGIIRKEGYKIHDWIVSGKNTIKAIGALENVKFYK